jgi:hypothetical protein
MDSQAFRQALTRHLYPVLRDEGFKGSGATLRRIAGPVVHVFNVQGSGGGARCYLNLGVHLAFLTPGRALSTLLEYDCALRDRMDPPAAGALGWDYGHSEDELEANARATVAAWAARGRPFFARHGRWPEDFTALVAAFDARAGHAATGLTIARIAHELGDTRRARAIAEIALANTPPRASGLRHDLAQLLSGLPS